jgi:peptide-methionine (R)-S-oxide reductase
VKDTKTDWKKQLSSEQYHVLVENGTEAPYTGKYYLSKDTGTYNCVACGNPLFVSDNKFDSDCGWPSFDKALPGAIEYHDDISHGMTRIEVRCTKCGGHLGHVFDDGPQETTGKRYCINSIALNFKKK